MYQNATCDDGNANTVNDVINGECVCAGNLLINGIYIMGNGISDIDGNFYPSIIINGQEWMQKNLTVSKYRNGDAIATGLSDQTWQGTINGAFAIYNNNGANNINYGKLYNWYSTVDPRGLCPAGWHVPSDDDWTILETNLGGSLVSGGKMKFDLGWNSPNTSATNESGFAGLPGGIRINYASDLNIGQDGNWWSTTGSASGLAWKRRLYYNSSNSFRGDSIKSNGLSVRCIKDQ